MKKVLFFVLTVLIINSGNYSCTMAEEAEQSSKAAAVEKMGAEINTSETNMSDSKNSDESKVLEAAVEYDWVNMLQLQRDEKIAKYHDILFAEINGKRSRKEFRTQYKDFLKDKDWRTHYRLISSGRKETNEENMSGFFTKFRGQDILYSYAIQPKSNLRRVYYYSAKGSLAYVDEISDNYPNFPYHSRQYRSSGKLAGTIYFETHDIQYVYAPDGKFKGIWLKDRMYDAKGKELMTRTNW